MMNKTGSHIQARYDRKNNLLIWACDSNAGGLWFGENTNELIEYYSPGNNNKYNAVAPLVISKCQADSGSDILQTDRRLLAYRYNSDNTEAYYEYINDFVVSYVENKRISVLGKHNVTN